MLDFHLQSTCCGAVNLNSTYIEGIVHQGIFNLFLCCLFIFSSQGQGNIFLGIFIFVYLFFQSVQVDVKTHFHTLALCESVHYIPAALEEHTHTHTPDCNRPSSALAVSSVKTFCVCSPACLCCCYCCYCCFFPSSHTLTIQCLADDFIILTSAADCVVWICLGCSCSRWSFHVHGYILHNRADSGSRRLLCFSGGINHLSA